MDKHMPQPLVADRRNRIYSIESLEAAGMSARHFFRLYPRDLVRLPFGSQLFALPQREPVAYDPAAKEFRPVSGRLAVAAFASPGYTATQCAAYQEVGRPRILPLFSYGAAAFYKGAFYVSAVKVDNEPRHDGRFIDIAKVRKNVKVFKRLLPGNRLVTHLCGCALTYGCPGAQNFFLSRYEGPLPASPFCNALCAGCISKQSAGRCPPTQPRIKFIPAPEEIKEIALFHIERVKDPVVSFGQGCDGEPLLVGDVLEKAIRLIRRETSKGVINMNTNGSIPGTVSRLFDAGLDSIRVSLNSARTLYYERYYKPRGYGFGDVMKSIKAAKAKKGFVSINYLTMSGFTDSRAEFDSLKGLIEKLKFDMIQWRNLNYDPLRYFREMRVSVKRPEILGMRAIMDALKEDFPRLKAGYYNPRYLY